MTGKEFKEHTTHIEALRSASQFEQAHESTIYLIQELFQERKFTRIADLFYSSFCDPPEHFLSFEIAYSLSEMGYIDDAEGVYEHLLRYDSENSTLLNNLSHIKETKHQIPEAFELIRKAYELAPHDDVIVENYQNLLNIIRQKQAVQKNYRRSLDFLQDESTYTMEKLRTFLANVRREDEFVDDQMPIPEWKFSVLLNAPPKEAARLVEQWMEKGYIRLTGGHDAHLIPIYSINPYLEVELPKIHKQLPPKWIKGFEALTLEKLEDSAYFSTLHKVKNIKGKYRDIIERDLNELFFNYVMKNEKSVIILAGSLVEAVLMYYCEEEQEITHLYQKRKNNRTVKRDLYDSDLSEMLNYLQEKKILSDLFVHIGNIARIYRNFIHPGRELREPELINQSKLDLCFLSTLEIMNSLLSSC